MTPFIRNILRMKKLCMSVFFLMLGAAALSQEETKVDTTQVETLDEVLLKAVRVEATSPITHSNLRY